MLPILRRGAVVAVMVAAVVTVMVAGCTSSIHPLTGTPSDAFDLEGSWIRKPGAKGSGPPKFKLEAVEQKAPGKGADAYWCDIGKREFDVSIFKIGDHHYVNAAYIHDEEHGESLPLLLLPLNLFARIDYRDETLRLYPIQEPSAREFFKKHGLSLIRGDDEFPVLSADSEQLRRAIEQHGDALFQREGVPFVRVRQPGETPRD